MQRAFQRFVKILNACEYCVEEEVVVVVWWRGTFFNKIKFVLDMNEFAHKFLKTEIESWMEWYCF